MKVKTQTTHALFDDEGELIVANLPYVPFDADDVNVERDENDAVTRVRYLMHDDDPSSYELNEGVVVHQFDSEEELDAWCERRAYNDYDEDAPDDYYSPTTWTLDDNDDPTMYRWKWGWVDGRTFGSGWLGIAVPDDFTNPEEAANNIYREFNAWADGDVWGVVNLEVVDGVVVDDSTCWGFIGDYSDVLKEEVES